LYPPVKSLAYTVIGTTRYKEFFAGQPVPCCIQRHSEREPRCRQRWWWKILLQVLPQT